MGGGSDGGGSGGSGGGHATLGITTIPSDRTIMPTPTRRLHYDALRIPTQRRT